MRIVITKNGKIIIQEINPEIKYKNMITYSTDKYRTNRKLMRQSLINKNLDRSNSFGHNSSTNFSNNINQKSIDIDDLLTNMRDIEKKANSPKIVNLTLNQKLNMPQSIAEKYMTKDTINRDDSENKNLLPDVFVSINKAIEKEASQKGYDYIYNSINSLNKQKTTDQNDNNISSHISLPSILPAYPLKYIINRNSLSKVTKEAIGEENKLKKGSILTEENFRSQNLPNPVTVLEDSLKNEIKTQNSNLIMYLNKSNDISGPFLKRISRYGDEQIKKLNKISQKTMFNKMQEDVISGIIKKKIKGEYLHYNEEYKEGLETMKEKLTRYENVIKAEERKIIDKKERYINFHRENEKEWMKYNIERFNKKNTPARRTSTQIY